MDLSHKLQQILEAEINRRLSDKSDPLYIARELGVLLTSYHGDRREHANDQTEQEQPNGNV